MKRTSHCIHVVEFGCWGGWFLEGHAAGHYHRRDRGHPSSDAPFGHLCGLCYADKIQPTCVKLSGIVSCDSDSGTDSNRAM